MKKFILILLISLSFGFGAEKIIIAHRGASGYLPEHTLESKALAYAMGAPYLEQDLAMTKDNHLVVIHDLYLDEISDVQEKFPKRHRKDKRYYVIDFTLKELRTLNFTENFTRKNGIIVPVYPQRFPVGLSHFVIHTYEEEIEFIQGLNKTLKKDVGLYTEVKAPWFHKQEGKDISKAALEVLKKYGYDKKDSKVFFQSFDYPDLVRIKTQLFPELGMDIKLVALIGKNEWNETYEKIGSELKPYNFTYLLTPKNFAQISKIVDGLGPSYDMLIDLEKSSKKKIIVNDLVKNAHKNSLFVHPYTIRADDLPPYANNVNELYNVILFKAGADGVFTDFPDLAVEFLESKK